VILVTSGGERMHEAKWICIDNQDTPPSLTNELPGDSI
jgi:hypothetical protein